MAYQFSNALKATARVYKPNEEGKFTIAGVNGVQTDANNFHTAITGLLATVGLTARTMERDITQEVEDLP